MNTEQKYMIEMKREAKAGQIIALSDREKAFCAVIDRLEARITKLEAHKSRGDAE
jgi:hypothetical protein